MVVYWLLFHRYLYYVFSTPDKGSGHREVEPGQNYRLRDNSLPVILQKQINDTEITEDGCSW